MAMVLALDTLDYGGGSKPWINPGGVIKPCTNMA